MNDNPLNVAHLREVEKDMLRAINNNERPPVKSMLTDELRKELDVIQRLDLLAGMKGGWL